MPIKIDPSDLEGPKQELSIFIENIEALGGLLLLKQQENNPDSQAVHFMDSYIIPELFPCYTALLGYLDNLLEIAKCLLKPAFMVDCIEIKNQRGKKYIDNGDHLHEYVIEAHSYLCLGEDNVKTGMLLIGLFENENVVKQNVADIKKFLNQDTESELGMRLREQTLKKLSANYEGSVEEYMADRTKETLKMLNEIETTCAQFKELVLATTPLRNKNCEAEYPFFFED